MLTPVFHPNFDEASVCIGDFWAASEGLDDLVIRIGRMIAYQEYNTRSPLNGLAAKWAAEHLNLLPIDGQDHCASTGRHRLRLLPDAGTATPVRRRRGSVEREVAPMTETNASGFGQRSR